MHPRFVTTKKGDYYSFELVDTDGEAILRSNFFRSKSDCTNEIAQVKSSVLSAVHFEKRKELSGQFSFVLKNKHHAVIGHSRPFWSPSSRDYAMMTVRREASDALVEEKFRVLEDFKE